jgi:anti-sigma factor RsiW
VIDHDPDELSAYALGMLDAEQAALVEAHLRDCGSCRADLAELRVATDALDEVPIETFVHGPPDGDQALRRAIGQLRGRAAGRRLTGLRVALVVALVLLALAVGILVGRTTATAPVPTTGPTARPSAAAATADAAHTPRTARTP